MAIDAYALCPGGTGKKIKFCCPDLLPELEKIDRMMDGDQYLAALQHIERLENRGDKRACLLSVKAILLRETEQLEAALANAAEFVERFPENALAWAESAILTSATENGRAAMPKLQRAIALSGKEFTGRTYEAMGAVALALLEDGDWLAARALWHTQMLMTDKDSGPMQQTMRLNRSADIPLLMKEEPHLLPAPPDAPWRAEFEEAVAALNRLRWQEAAEKLSALAAKVPDAPAVWRDLAIVRGWLTDDEGAIEAWRKYASLHLADQSSVALDDAVEAEALALMLSKDPLGDAINLLQMSWTVRDAERLQELLLSDRRIVNIPFNPAAMADQNTPPPRMIGMILDRPAAETAEGITLAAMPRMLGQCLLFGRQTDREARLDILAVSEPDAELLKNLLREIGGETLEGEPRQETAGQTSGSHQLLVQKWYPPRDVTREQMDRMAAEGVRDALLQKWPDRPLGVLGGKTPREAAADPANHARLLAAILLLEHWTERSPVDFDFNDLRTALGLPVVGPIDPQAAAVQNIPLVRLERLVVENLSDDDLAMVFRRAMLYNAVEALRKFARAILARYSFAERPERFQAHSVLAQTAENPEQALAHIEEGRAATLAAGRSCASWDLMELPFRFALGHAREAMGLVQHVQQRHIEEPGVGQALTQLLVEVGILRPDGTPAMPMGRQPGGPAAMPEPAAEAGRLWTPGSDEPGTGGGGKLWTPG
jgi:hypothetical protein